MRVLATCLAAFVLLAGTSAMAAGAGDKDAPPAKNAADATSTSSADPAKPATPASGAALEAELQQLRDLLQTQSAQLDAQRDALQATQKKMDALEAELKAAKSALSNAAAVASPGNAAPGATPAGSTTGSATLATGATAAAVNPNGDNAPNAFAGLTATTLNNAQGSDNGPAQTASLHFKGITLTPGGFFAAEGVWRQKALAADVDTPFNSLNFTNSSNAGLNELNFSGRQSRISMLAQGKINSATIGGYYEGDFLSAGVTSNSNESNSYTFRQRQFFGQASFESGWTITGGQMWSLVTETRHGEDNRTEALPLTVDAQYHVGFSWARQWGFRVVKNFGNKVWLGASAEESETTFAGHGFTCAAATTATTTTPATPATCILLIAQPGTLGGLDNNQANYSYQRTPDFVVKAAFEPGWGHYEIFGLVSDFQDRVFPNAATFSAAGAFNDSRAGGGVGANARMPIIGKYLDLGLHFFGGDGIGRYGTTGLADVTVRPDGTLAPLHNFQGLGTLEAHLGKADVYANVGGEYEERAAYMTSTGKFVGYGLPNANNSGCFTEVLPGGSQNTPGVAVGSAGTDCTGDTRNIIEGTIGFWYRFYKGDKGTFQFGPQYSYYVRNTWSGAKSLQPHADENMVFLSLRYYIP